VGQSTLNSARTHLVCGLSSRVEFNPLLKKLNFSQSNPTQIHGELDWLTS